MLPIKAYGTFDNAGAIINAYNCTSSGLGVNGYTITLAANVVTGTSWGVIAISAQPTVPYPLVPRYSITSPTTVDIAFSTPATSGVANLATSFTVIILQV